MTEPEFSTFADGYEKDEDDARERQMTKYVSGLHYEIAELQNCVRGRGEAIHQLSVENDRLRSAISAAMDDLQYNAPDLADKKLWIALNGECQNA
jgi:hypothetical protein